MGFVMTDNIIESSDDTDLGGNGDIASIDLNVRISRFNVENNRLKEELLRLEDTALTQENEINAMQKKLNCIKDKNTKISKENDDLQKKLGDSDKQMELLQKNFETKCGWLVKNIDLLERERHNTSILQNKISDLTKDIENHKKEIFDLKLKYASVCKERDQLQEYYNELEKSYNDIIITLERNEKEREQQHEKISDLEARITEMQSRNHNRSANSDRLSLSPQPYNYVNAHIHSTPYSAQRNYQPPASLFAELKASGYNEGEIQLKELKEELSFYNDEIAEIADQIDGLLQEIATSKNKIYVPKVQLTESSGIDALKHKIFTLTNIVKTLSQTSNAQLPTSSRENSDLQEGTYVVYKEVQKITDTAGSELHCSVTSSTASINEICSKSDRSTSPLGVTLPFSECSEIEEVHDQEIVKPIVEALDRIIESKAENDVISSSDALGDQNRIQKKKSIFTNRNLNDLSLAKPIACSTFKFSKVEEASTPTAHLFAKGDSYTIDELTKQFEKMERLTADPSNNKFNKPIFQPGIFQSYSNNISNEPLMPNYNNNNNNDDTPSKTFVVGKSASTHSLDLNSLNKDIENYIVTPVKNGSNIPRRKLSVYERSFDIDSFPLSSHQYDSYPAMKHSVSSPNVQEKGNAGIISQNGYLTQKLDGANRLIEETPLSRHSMAISTYRSNSNIDIDESTDSSPDLTPIRINCDESLAEEIEKNRGVISKASLFQPKFKLPKSMLINHTHTKNPDEINETNTESKCSSLDNTNKTNGQVSVVSLEPSDLTTAAHNDTQLIDTSPHNNNRLLPGITSDLEDSSRICNGDENYSEECSSCSGGSHVTEESLYEKEKQLAESRSNATVNNKINRSISGEESVGSENPNSSENACSDVSSGAYATTKSAVAVVSAMSSGEDTSDSESERTSSHQQLRNNHESEEEDVRCPRNLREHERPELSNMDSDQVLQGQSSVENSEKLITTSGTGTTTEIDNETVTLISAPKGIEESGASISFPTWTDERLRESGLQNLSDVEDEIRETLSEDELQRKCTAFSVGLGTDRMTLLSRMKLSRQQRDQAEKNFEAEVGRIEFDIQELKPLCVNSEYTERVERVKRQVEIICRCAHRIACTAETLGAVNQERRVSRAVILADKYLQSLRHKCEKLAGELSEKKKILAENNIFDEESSEIRDDNLRLRHRTLPNNNRTMAARRRASIAGISSRPLLGSSIDVSKELPRQRVSFCGRVPPVIRRPSFCFDLQKCDAEQVHRTESTHSITELHEIFELAESRRQSCEENNNLPKTVIKHSLDLYNEEQDEENFGFLPSDKSIPNMVTDIDLTTTNVPQYQNAHLIWWFFFTIAFLLGFIINSLVTSDKQDGPAKEWWSLEEIINRHIQLKNQKSSSNPPL